MSAATLLCLVIAITDGDTLKARCAEQTVTVRLSEIDAPERQQPWGTRSRQHLAELCFQKAAEVRPTTKDRYGRTVARVTCAGTDANLAMARDGYAWAYTRYLTDRRVAGAEQLARREHLGLWADAHHVPPWTWRRPK